MDIPIVASETAHAQRGSGPWSPSVLDARAVAELQDLALTLFRQEKDPCDIFCALIERSALLADAHGIAPLPVGRFVRALPGLSEWDAERAIGEYVAAALAERRRRSVVVADWLTAHAETPAAEAVVRAAQKICVARIEEALWH